MHQYLNHQALDNLVLFQSTNDWNKNDKHRHFIQLSEFHTLHRYNRFQTSQINTMQLLLVWTLLHKTTNLFAYKFSGPSFFKPKKLSFQSKQEKKTQIPMYTTVSCPIPGHKEEEKEDSARLSNGVTNNNLCWLENKVSLHQFIS
jgi:hypothetical protein